MAGIRFIYAESRLRGGNDFRRVQHAADQQQSHDNGQRDAVDGERLVREGGHELQEADDHGFYNYHRMILKIKKHKWRKLWTHNRLFQLLFLLSLWQQ